MAHCDSITADRLQIGKGKIRVGIDAPEGVAILRDELTERPTRREAE